MNDDNRLETLKAGDYVFLCTMYGKTLEQVEKITPSGLIKVKGLYFYKSGTQRDRGSWYLIFLQFADEAEIQTYKNEQERRKLIKYISALLKIEYVEFKKLEEIIKILRG